MEKIVTVLEDGEMERQMVKKFIRVEAGYDDFSLEEANKEIIAALKTCYQKYL